MSESLTNYNTGYIVYVISNRYKKTFVGITDEINGFTFRFPENFSRLVYYEKFEDRNKARIKKRLLAKSDQEKIRKLVSKNNPEWLNLIYTIFGEPNYKLIQNHKK